MKKALLVFFVAAIYSSVSNAVTVIIQHSNDDVSENIIHRLEANLGQVLTEVNAAYRENRALNTVGLPMNNFAKRMMVTTWDGARFYCDDEELIVDEFYSMKDSYMLRQVPMLLSPADAAFDNNLYQEVIVEFDKQGIISDFRFALGSWQSEGMNKCGVADVERTHVMLELVERLASAYCRKDTSFLRQIFSDDALIITGKVVGKSDKGIRVVYSENTKEEYLRKLFIAFKRNKYIDVKLRPIDGEEGACAWVTRSAVNPNFYGVRLHQAWRSSSYNDDGYVFLLWDFRKEDEPVIHVRTWQPSMVKTSTGFQAFPEEDIFSITSVEDKIPREQ